MSTADQQSHQHDEAACRRYLECLSEYVDGELADDLCRELEAHMALCENCRVVVNTLSKTIVLYHRLPSPDLPDEVRDRLYKVLDIRPYARHTGESGQG